MNIVVAGSLAKDVIMVFPGYFKDHIIPEKIHMLNLSFLVEDMKECYGGTAGNISYNMSLLGEDCMVMGKLGSDGSEYVHYLAAKGLNTDLVSIDSHVKSARAHVTTDQANNQLTAFYPGASAVGEPMLIPAKTDWDLVLVAPMRKDDMISVMRQAIDQKKPFVFDPGQMTPYFDDEELHLLLPETSLLIGNDYEISLIQETMGISLETLCSIVESIIVTKGEEGSVLYENGIETTIPAVQEIMAKDPTGAGDAYRAGILWAFAHKQDNGNENNLLDGMRLGSVLASFSIAFSETQTHTPCIEDIQMRFEKTYNTNISLDNY